MAECNLEQIIKSGVDKVLNKPIMNGKSITQWAAIGMKAPQWVSVEERLPENIKPVLVWESQGFAYVDNYRDGAWSIGSANCAIITHWMPLPKPPKEVNQ